MPKFEISLFMGKSILENQNDIINFKIEILKNNSSYKIENNNDINYIKEFSKIQNSIIVLLKDNNKLVGLLFALPLIYEDKDMLLSWQEYDINSIYYFEEILILPQYNQIELKQEILITAEDWIKGFNKYDFFLISSYDTKEELYINSGYSKLEDKNINNKLHFWIKKI